MDSVSIVDSIHPDPPHDTITPLQEPNPTAPDPERTQQPETVQEPELPKPWNIDDPFQYAPPKPDGDHWDLLLEPVRKEAQIQCDALRDEVQNLLIFAGLFSAVVTAFTIESYKGLQQNPTDSMISLLAHIAQRLDGPMNATSSMSLPVQKPFSPSASTIRVNNFWLISLVLSLATVLVGIVSLQWLREYQNFSDLSSRERYAVSVMRSKAMDKWYVDKIFTAMPLMLQCALILFLGGLVDFIHGFGDRNVLVPVTIAIALTLFFIVATALLPSLQILSLYFRVPHFGQAKGQWVDPPYPCPYKSPQSDAFRQLFRPLIILCGRLYPAIHSTSHAIRRHIKIPFLSAAASPVKDDDFTRYLHSASMSEDWTSFDLSWLTIRDGYLRRTYGRSSVDELLGRSWKANILLGGRDKEIVPINDIITGITTQVLDKATSILAYHAFCEISELTLLPFRRPDYYFETLEDFFRQSAYLHDLLIGRISDKAEATLTDIFDLDDLILKPITPEFPTSLHDILAILIHHQNTSYFLRYQFICDAPTLSTHRIELVVRLIRYFCLNHGETRPETQDRIAKGDLLYPGCLVLTQFESDLGPDFISEVRFDSLAWQVCDVILLVLQQLPSSHQRQSGLNGILSNFFAQSSLLSFMDTASYFTSHLLRYPVPPALMDQLQAAVQDTLYAIFSLFESRLTEEMTSWTSAEGRPTLFFYLAALYTWPLIIHLQQHPKFLALHSIIRKYKRRTIDMGITDCAIENNLKADPSSKYYSVSFDHTFSTDWWSRFDMPLTVPDSTSSGRNSPSIVVYYPFSTSENSLPHD